MNKCPLDNDHIYSLNPLLMGQASLNVVLLGHQGRPSQTSRNRVKMARNITHPMNNCGKWSYLDGPSFIKCTTVVLLINAKLNRYKLDRSARIVLIIIKSVIENFILQA